MPCDHCSLQEKFAEPAFLTARNFLTRIMPFWHKAEAFNCTSKIIINTNLVGVSDNIWAVVKYDFTYQISCIEISSFSHLQVYETYISLICILYHVLLNFCQERAVLPISVATPDYYRLYGAHTVIHILRNLCMAYTCYLTQRCWWSGACLGRGHPQLMPPSHPTMGPVRF